MEIGWYLRFKPGRTIRALVQPSTRGQLENTAAMFPERTMTITDHSDHLEVLFFSSAVREA